MYSKLVHKNLSYELKEYINNLLLTVETFGDQLKYFGQSNNNL